MRLSLCDSKRVCSQILHERAPAAQSKRCGRPRRGSSPVASGARQKRQLRGRLRGAKRSDANLSRSIGDQNPSKIDHRDENAARRCFQAFFTRPNPAREFLLEHVAPPSARGPTSSTSKSPGVRPLWQSTLPINSYSLRSVSSTRFCYIVCEPPSPFDCRPAEARHYAHPLSHRAQLHLPSPHRSTTARHARGRATFDRVTFVARESGGKRRVLRSPRG